MYYITINVQYVRYSTGRKIKYFIVYRLSFKTFSSTSDLLFEEISSPDQLRHCRHPYDLEGRGGFLILRKCTYCYMNALNRLTNNAE